MFKYQIYSNLLINLILFKSKCGIREKKPFKNHSILLKSVWIWTNLMVLNLRIVFDPSKTRLFEIFKVKMKSNWSLSDIISRNWYFEEKVQPFINYILYWNQTIRPEIRWINPLNGIWWKICNINKIQLQTIAWGQIASI